MSPSRPTSSFNPATELASTMNTTPISNVGDNPSFIPKKMRKHAFINNQKTMGGNTLKDRKSNIPLSEKKRRLTRPTMTGVMSFKFQQGRNKKDKTPRKVEMPKIFEKKKTTRRERILSIDSKQKFLKEKTKSSSRTPLFSPIQKAVANMPFFGRNISPLIKHYKAKNKNKYNRTKPKKKLKLDMAKNIEENSRVNMRYLTRNNPENMSVMSSRAIERLHDTVGNGVSRKDSNLSFVLGM
eukprot:CAMPEP_0196998984 /NCGR_PEP_ID=MMETSP1380-20130617/4261_1 /TAXON_ID=5936 /ORGANISM="Euplotes crassus, Strain CT5" /LENGTH=239 /DNA_ID=CAMNT_0042415757 /DNA_START=208 /DNA_END=927 /DNA_ORIENTATION=-